MHIEKSGNRGPIVVFVSGLGADSSAWRAVAGPISDFAQVVRYDRAGLGLSKPLTTPGRPITARDVVDCSIYCLRRRSRAVPEYPTYGHRGNRSWAIFSGMGADAHALAAQLAILSPRGTLVIADGSGHDIATDRPALVTAAVRTMVDAVSGHR